MLCGANEFWPSSREHAAATVNELSELCDVSEVTVRQDLNQLSEEGLLIRTRRRAAGRAQRQERNRALPRGELNAFAKQRIGELAAAMVDSSDTVLIDASTGISVGAGAGGTGPATYFYNVTILTNGIYATLELLARPDFTTIVTGGQMRADNASLTGSFAWRHLERVMANIGFFGTRGLTLAYGVTDLNIHEADVKRMIAIEHCHEVVIVSDSSKFDDVSLVTFAEIPAIHHLITDDGAPADVLDALRTRGVHVTLAVL